MLSAGAEALSAAKGKHLAADRDRPFTEFTLERSEGLRVTRCDGSNYQVLFFKLNLALRVCRLIPQLANCSLNAGNFSIFFVQ